MKGIILASKLKLLAAALATAGLLAGCGGGGGAETTPKARVTSVKVMGDSLSDSGTFGFKFTVQGSDTDGKPYMIWAERIADLYGQSLCPHYLAGSENLVPVTVQPSCTNYAIGGGMINPQGAAAATPLSIINQIRDAGAAGLSGNDLILIDGGANDAAALITAVLTYQATVAAGVPAATAIAPLQAFLGSRIDAPTLGALLAQGPQGMAQAGGLYMQLLAQGLAATIQAELLAKGATRVALLNIPAITMTPKFAAVLRQIEQKQGTQAKEQSAALFDGWVKAFNAALKGAVQGESRIALVDFYTGFTDQVANPGSYGFRNSTLPACVLAGVDDGHLELCTTAVLAAHIPAGETQPDWWQNYVFANSFHPTPKGYQQMSQLVSRALAQAGWL
jgi:phospholipase/lecithinase/hemolysin